MSRVTKTTVLTLPKEGIACLKSLETAITSAKVEKVDEHGNVQYSNQSLDRVVMPLLKCVGLDRQGYTAWKMTNNTPIENRTGAEHIIPINVLGNTKPEITPGGVLQPGEYIYHDGPVDLIPSLNCLFVGKPVSNSPSNS